MADARTSLPTWLLGFLAAGGVGLGGYNLLRPEQVSPIGLSRAEVVEVARAEAQAAEVRAVETGRRELAAGQALLVQQVGQISTSIQRLEGKVDTLQAKVDGLAVDVAALKARQGRGR